MNIIVTGASSGIGRAVGNALAAKGHSVIAVARTLPLLESLKQSFPDLIHVIATDISTESGCDDVVEYVKTAAPVNAIVHAAGSRIEPLPYEELDTKKLIQDMNIHVLIPILLNNRLKDALQGGRVLFVDSYSAINPRVGWAGYSIVKAAAQMAARAAAEEIFNARVVRVFPGAVRTPLVEAVLNSTQASPTVNLFRELNSKGEIINPALIGEFIANILVTATDSQLDERETWDFSRPEDQIFSSV